MKRFNLPLLSAAVGLAVAGISASGAKADIYTVDVWSYAGSAPGSSTGANETNPILNTAPTYVFTYGAPINWSTPGPQTSPNNTGLDFIGSTNFSNVTWISGDENAFKNNELSVPGDSTSAFFHIAATWTSSSSSLTSGNLTSDDGSTLIIGGTKLANMAAEQGAQTQNFSTSQVFNGAPLDLYYVEGNGAPAVLDFNISGGNLTAPVPEASTWAMMILGFFGVGFMAYRRKSEPALRLA
jgi:hypothetical protein